MPAPLAKGIIVSLSILAALGIAIYENPQVKEWIDEQRRKIAEALRSIGNELDPQSRRQAEAFAYEGRLPTQEAAAAANAVAVATGRDSNPDAVTRRMTTRSDTDPVDAAERRRLGREYLARRNQEMLNRQRKTKSGATTDPEKQPLLSSENEKIEEDRPRSLQKSSSGSFDDIVNDDGTLKLNEKEPELELPSVPTNEPASLKSLAVDMISRATAAAQAASANGTSGLPVGMRYANPFSDEYEYSGSSLLDRSATPKPPVPPKEPLDQGVSDRRLPGSFSDPSRPSQETTNDFSYDTQLARALSLSLAESEAHARAARKLQEEQDPDLAAAIAESLKISEHSDAKSSSSHQQRGYVIPEVPPLVDLTPATTAQRQTPRQGEQLYREMFSQEGSSAVPAAALSPISTGDELYSVSPAYRPAVPAFMNTLEHIHRQYDPVRDAAGTLHRALSSVQDINNRTQVGGTSPSGQEGDAESSVFTTDSETDDFASMPDSDDRSRAPSVARSEASLIEVEDVNMESVDSDEDGDGIKTPGSWTDVGSDVGESERSESDAGDAVRV